MCGTTMSQVHKLGEAEEGECGQKKVQDQFILSYLMNVSG